ncbi:MarR family winged helix-turn-helix transcriptional regulator [Bombilactobacillus bombi]|uniref:MarR family winged helix-turn-helix transcriptional regulator n=1 Tax=Bombilactobacillus bombi TaxID=1303590 RepID=UPI0015E61728|nr:MarR family winged helix-turn-helix transcriptional regulator [Bombilactobacillus bombi]MBA1434235.1 MarR family transcriptional regulator [Bombilactobacillus bombi]
MNSKSFLHFEIGFYRLKRRLLQEFLKPYNLKVFEGLLVTMVAARPGCSQGDIINYVMADEASVARGLRNLEDQELIVRHEDPNNHRKKLVYPTVQATKIYQALNNFLDNWDKVIFKDLNAQELQTLDELVLRVENDLKKVDYRQLIAELTKTSKK